MQASYNHDHKECEEESSKHENLLEKTLSVGGDMSVDEMITALLNEVKWECRMCTFANLPKHGACEICSASKPKYAPNDNLSRCDLLEKMRPIFKHLEQLKTENRQQEKYIKFLKRKSKKNDVDIEQLKTENHRQQEQIQYLKETSEKNDADHKSEMEDVFDYYENLLSDQLGCETERGAYDRDEKEWFGCLSRLYSKYGKKYVHNLNYSSFERLICEMFEKYKENEFAGPPYWYEKYIENKKMEEKRIKSSKYKSYEESEGSSWKSDEENGDIDSERRIFRGTQWCKDFGDK